MDGYIKLHRQLLENPIWTQLSATALKVWIGCLLRANWKPSKWYDGSAQVEFPAGASIFSQDSLSKLCRVSRQELRTALAHLVNLGFVTMRSTNQYSLLVIENWTTYQSDTEMSNQAEILRWGGNPPERQKSTSEPTSENQSHVSATKTIKGFLVSRATSIVTNDQPTTNHRRRSKRSKYMRILRCAGIAIIAIYGTGRAFPHRSEGRGAAGG